MEFFILILLAIFHEFLKKSKLGDFGLLCRVLRNGTFYGKIDRGWFFERVLQYGTFYDKIQWGLVCSQGVMKCYLP
jgi:hypothetical protein